MNSVLHNDAAAKSIQILFTYLESNRPKNKSRVFVPVYVVA